jgi:hypothetical protein
MEEKYNGLASKFELGKEYDKSEVDAGLKDLSLSGSGLVGRLKGFLNRRAMHGENGERTFFLLGPGLKWVFFDKVSRDRYRFAFGQEDM